MRSEEDKAALYQDRVNYKVLGTVAVILIVGIALLLVSHWIQCYATWKAIIGQLGGLLVVTAVISVAWEVAVKRAFLDEILAKSHVSRDIQFSGITKITDIFHTDVPWGDLIRQSAKIDLFFAYAQTWRNTHVEDFRCAAAKADTRIRVVLPDPDDDQTITELARRFSYEKDVLRGRVNEAKDFFQRLCGPDGSRRAAIEVWFLPAAPTFTCYRFDKTAVLTTYTHRPGRGAIPTFVCEEGGTLCKFIREEFDALVSGNKPLARKVS